MAVSDLDPRWEWIEIQLTGDPAPRYLKGACRHLDIVPVDTLAGEIIGHLCLTCDALLEADPI